jgi:FkbM family methyltransferase
MVVVDIGANIGYYTLLAAKLIGSVGKVIAFEPSSDNCALLQQSLQVNGLTNVVLMPYAVADLDGTVSYGMDDSNGRIAVDLRTDLTPVPAVTLDRVLAGEPRIDFIKMDIEGAEGRALRGMQQLLRTHRPIVCTEFSPDSLPTTSGLAPEEYLDLWRALGYQLSVIPKSGVWNPRSLTNTEIMNNFAAPSILDHIDLLAMPKTTVDIQ